MLKALSILRLMDMKVNKENLVVMRAKLSNVLYVLQDFTVIGSIAVTSFSMLDSDNTRLWHMRLGYISAYGIMKLSERGLLSSQSLEKLDLCEHCVFGKQKRVNFKAADHYTKSTLDYIHFDIWGLSYTLTYGGTRYILTFIDDCECSI